METILQRTLKKDYCAPLIERIEIDCEISLAFESEDPPTNETMNNKSHEYFNANPFERNFV